MKIIQETNRYEVHDRWVWRVCLVELPNGTQAFYDIPLHPLGRAR